MKTYTLQKRGRAAPWRKTGQDPQNTKASTDLLDAKNIISVYRATGNPEDDGYLTSSAAQNAINAQNSPDSFRYLYSLAVNNPNNYSLPRMIRAGLSFEF